MSNFYLPLMTIPMLFFTQTSQALRLNEVSQLTTPVSLEGHFALNVNVPNSYLYCSRIETDLLEFLIHNNYFCKFIGTTTESNRSGHFCRAIQTQQDSKNTATATGDYVVFENIQDCEAEIQAITSHNKNKTEGKR